MFRVNSSVPKSRIINAPLANGGSLNSTMISTTLTKEVGENKVLTWKFDEIMGSFAWKAADLATISPNSKIQVLKHTETLDPEASVYVVDIEHYHSSTMGHHCNQFTLPEGKVGQTKLIYCKNLKHVVFYSPNLYNNISELHFRYPNQGALIQYQEIDGWTLLGFTQNTGINVPKLISYNGQKPFYLYILCTARRMPMYNDVGQLVPQPFNGKWRRDYVAVVDLNPMNATYGQIVERIYTNPDNVEPDELHHGHMTNNNNFIIAPGLSSSAINVIDLRISERHPVLKRRIPPTDIWATGLSNLHTVLESELWGNDIIISALSVANNTTPEGPRGNGGKGGFILLNNGFENTEEFPKSVKTFIDFAGIPSVSYNYDFQLKECYEVMTSTEWTHYGTQDGFDNGFFNPTVNPVAVDRYGHKVHVWDLINKNLIQTLDLRNTFLADNFGAPRDIHVNVPNSGEVPLEIRFLNKEMARIAIIGCVTGLKLDPSNPDSGLALNGGVIVALYCPPDKDPKGPNWFAKQVAFIPNEYNWLPAITDITLSKDEKCLYVSCWLTGRLIQFDLSKVQDVIDGKLSELPILSSVILGGEPDRPDAPNNYKVIKGKVVNGGPQMLRLTPNGRDLYVTNSLYSSWDEQFYPAGTPKTIQSGSWLIKVNTGIENGVKVADMTVDEKVFIDFEGEPDGPTRAHECHMRGTTH